MDTLFYDLRYALRTLRANPGFAAVAVLSLALGIGANAAIYSLYSSIFLKRLPVSAPDELVEIYTRDADEDAEMGMEYSVSAYPDFADLRAQSGAVFTDVILYNVAVLVLENETGSEYLFGEEVTPNYFEALGVEAQVGRTFIEAEDGNPDSAPVVVIGHTFWQNRFGGDPGVIGRPLRLNGHDFTIIGVAPKKFRGMYPLTADYWHPITLDKLIHPGSNTLDSRGSRSLWMKGRLREGVTVEQAQAAVEVIGARLASEYVDTNEDRSFILVPTRQVSLHPQLDRLIKGFTWLLMGMIGLVLLIACVNLAGMLLARATARRREIGVRLALGAPRSRLIRQLVTESTVLALIGGAVGLLFAAWLIHLLVALQPPIPIPINLDLGIDARVLLFTFALSLVTGVVFGLLPAFKTTGHQLMDAIRNAHAGGGRLRRFGLRNGLVVVQVTVSALLLVCTGLFLRSLGRASSVETGFTLRQGVIALIETYDMGYTVEQGRAFMTDLTARMSTLPGVESVALTDRLPLGAMIQTREIYPETELTGVDPEGIDTDYAVVGPEYFRTLGVPILAGRGFEASDTEQSQPVVMVNRTFAERYWPGDDAVGRQLRDGGATDDIFTIVGVTADGKYRALGEDPRPYVYFPYAQRFSGMMYAVARTAGEARDLVPTVRAFIRELDPHLPIFDLMTVPEHLQLMLFLPRALAGLLAGLGLLSLILGTTGLYGIIAYDVSRRTREVGIRMSVGARRSQVLWLILRDGLKLVITGTVLGLIVAVPFTGLLRSLLFGITPLDPVTYAGVAILFLLVAVAATLTPARRASAVDPVNALRVE